MSASGMLRGHAPEKGWRDRRCGAVAQGSGLQVRYLICWPEPFGLVMIEAMSCGTPILAYRAGSVPEIIDEGVTGMIVDNIDQARIALVQVAALDRRKVRSRFEERFTARRMAKDYVRVYRGLVRHAAQPGRGTRHPVNGGAHVSGDELVNDVDAHAD
jgi:hypothetical protein